MICMPAALRAEEILIALDSAKTKVGFVVTDVLHTVHGSFQLKEGHIVLDSSTGVISGDVVIDAASGDVRQHASR